jgi:cyclopropane-fatty-acyl-phospholipid synthase
MAAFYESWLDRNLLPDWLIRIGIRRLLAQRLIDESRRDPVAWRNEISSSPLATHTPDANAQHYEVPTDFFLAALGPRRKYSCAWYETGRETLAEAEIAMLKITCERAQLRDGDSILELGCGWGSLSLWMAEHYPNSKIVAVSNSRTQKAFIDAEAASLSLHNLEVRTADMVHFNPGQQFDRVVSVEMFEHMRNYAELLRRISTWLNPAGTLFVHIFTHRNYAYPFETGEQNDWMAQHFFSGGQMPSDALLTEFQDHLRHRETWRINGRHYAQTCEHWLRNMDANEAKIRPLFAKCYGKDEETKWIVRWRVFFLACAELFAYKQGSEWGVCHYLFQKP